MSSESRQRDQNAPVVPVSSSALAQFCDLSASLVSSKVAFTSAVKSVFLLAFSPSSAHYEKQVVEF